MRIVILFAVLIIAAGCGQKSPTTPSNNSNGNNTSGSTLTASIDGVAFVGKTVTATYHEGADASSLLVNAQDAGNNLLSFDIAPPLKTAFTTGTYALGSNGSNATYNPFGMIGWTGLTGPQTGSVVVTSINKTSKTAAGTFSFVLNNSSSKKTITNGVFSVMFP